MRPVEIVWHRIVAAVSIAALVALVPGLGTLRAVIEPIFLVFLPGMALAGRSRHLRKRGLWSAETWSLVVPLSFAVGMCGSLLSAYWWWAPRALFVVVVSACAISSIERLRSATDGGSAWVVEMAESP